MYSQVKHFSTSNHQKTNKQTNKTKNNKQQQQQQTNNNKNSTQQTKHLPTNISVQTNTIT